MPSKERKNPPRRNPDDRPMNVKLSREQYDAWLQHCADTGVKPTPEFTRVVILGLKKLQSGGRLPAMKEVQEPSCTKPFYIGSEWKDEITRLKTETGIPYYHLSRLLVRVGGVSLNGVGK